MKRTSARIKRQLWTWIFAYCEAIRTGSEPNSRQRARIDRCVKMITNLMDELESL